jgi:hypothetical protein
MNIFELFYALIIIEAFFWELRRTITHYLKEKKKK